MTTLRESISRVKTVFKSVNEDAFLTDRYVYSVIKKYAAALIRRQDNENKLMQYDSLFEVLPYVELKEVDKIEADCAGIKTGCKIMRTRKKLPKVHDGSTGPIFRLVSSIDGTYNARQTRPQLYTAMTKSSTFKYNKNVYWWYKNGYIYIPAIQWEAVSIEGMFAEPTDGFCKEDGEDTECTVMQDTSFNIPDYIMAEIEQLVQQELITLGKIPSDNSDNSQNILR